MDVILKKSKSVKYKYVAIITISSASSKKGKKIKKVNFGAKGYSDFLKHKDVERKRRYILRHKKKEDWTDPLTAGFWSRWLLWNKSTIELSIKDIEKRFDITITLK